MPEKKNQYIDVHCHILPEVDDGARNLEESLAMLRQEVKQGAAAVILTPHQKPNRRSIPLLLHWNGHRSCSRLRKKTELTSDFTAAVRFFAVWIPSSC